MTKKKLPVIISGLLLGISILLFAAAVIYLHAANSDKTLIVYFTRVGNTDFSEDVDAVSSASLRRDLSGELEGNCEVMANTLKKATGADTFSITVEDKYPESYEETVSRASEEQSDDARPILSGTVENMDKYEKIILVYPVWWSTMPMPVFTFLESYDLSGKDIYPIATHKGSFLGSSVDDVKKLCPDSEIHAGVPIAGGSVDWIGIIPIAIIVSLAFVFAGFCVRYKCEVKTKGAYLGAVLTVIGVIVFFACLIRVMI
ncbi:MAG: flavodoxin [Porcipelethomonas sp.]